MIKKKQLQMHILRKVSRFPLYPFFLAAYPPLALLLYNISEIRFSGALRAIVLSCLVIFILFLLAWLLHRDKHRAAFAVFTLGILFFLYGHVYNLLAEKLPGLVLEPGLWMLWSGLLLLTQLWAGLRKARFERAAPGLNLVTLGLLLVVSTQITWFSMPGESNAPADEFAPMQVLELPGQGDPPDIYYIIVDSYGRSDLLQSAFDYDNSSFLQALEEMGFYVADCAQSNYNRTDVSLASSLNLDYLQNLSADFQPSGHSRRTLWASIEYSAARLMLEQAGYTSVAFSTGFAWSEVDASDIFLEPQGLNLSPSSFELLLLQTTPLRHLEDADVINLTAIDGQHFRERTLFILDKLDDLNRIPGPLFAFIHILPPHPPFVFAPDGSFTDPAPYLNEDDRYTYATYTQGYQNQVAFISDQLEDVLHSLLAASDEPPIIILQGDHAPWLQTGSGKFMILNAYHLPGHDDQLYNTISPVNTFRVIFNAYFGTDYELLPDKSYYSPIPNIFNFEEFRNPCATD